MRAQLGVALSAVDDGGARLSCAIDEAGNTLHVREVDIGADLGLLITRVALTDLRGALDEALLERVGDAFLHE